MSTAIAINSEEGKICRFGKEFSLSNVYSLNSLPDDKILDKSKWKQIADDILKSI